MFLERVKEENEALVAVVNKLHQKGMIEPDTYVVDVDTVMANSWHMLQAAQKVGLELFVMTKQFGRNPYLAKKLIGQGYKGVVAVDYRDASQMMAHNIPLAHIGHLVQIPEAKLLEVLKYSVEYITVYSIEKARQINDLCKELGKVQKILLKVVEDGDLIYPSQEAGFSLQEIKTIVKEIQKFDHIAIAGLTAFPCLMYDINDKAIKPTPNVKTLKAAKACLEEVLGYELLLNMPSCTQTVTIPLLHELGAKQGEPGSSLMGMTPNQGVEKIGMVYVSEIAHHYKGQSFCYGGGFYRRGLITQAWVGKNKENMASVLVEQPAIEAIDYHFKLNGIKPIGDTVIMSFRTQIFVTRSKVALIEGIQQNNPKIVGIYDSQGRRESIWEDL